MNPKIIKFRKQILKIQQRLKRSLNKNKRKSYISQIKRLFSKIEKDFEENRQNEVATCYCPICGKYGKWRSGQEFEHMMRCSHSNLSNRDFIQYSEYTPVWIPGRQFKRWGW